MHPLTLGVRRGLGGESGSEDGGWLEGFPSARSRPSVRIPAQQRSGSHAVSSGASRMTICHEAMRRSLMGVELRTSVS